MPRSMIARSALALLAATSLWLAGCAHADLTPPLALEQTAGGYAARMAPGFLWGVATAGQQWEGGDTTSNWAAWEAAGHTPDTNTQAVRGWSMYDEDLDLAKGMGVNAFRFSIEWARIEPKQGQIDQAAVQHYRDLLADIHAHGMTPVVTLMHFAYPEWLEAKGGWTNPEAIDDYVKYVTFVAKTFGPQITYYLTFNEPNMLILNAYGSGNFPPGKKFAVISGLKVAENLIQAHKLAYAAIHANDPDAKVSFNMYAAQYALGQQQDPNASNGENWYLKKALGLDEPANGQLKTPQRTLDFVSFDYYCRVWLGFPFKIQPDNQWEVYPEGIYNAIHRYYNWTHLPVLIAENGMATSDLAPRPDHWTRGEYLVAHVAQVQRAIAEGVPVIGYIHWSITDNYEWGSYTPRFGLYSVNAKAGDFTRVPTDGVAAYRSVIANGGVTPAIQAEYPPPGKGTPMLADMFKLGMDTPGR